MGADRRDEQQFWPGRPQRYRRATRPRHCLMYGNRVVVTGLGAVTPIGLSVDEYWANLLGGVSGVARISLFDPEGLPVQIAAEVKNFDPGDFMDRKAAKRM